MTIDEAIIHCEEVMVENLEKTKDRNASDPIAINCFECADEHRQLTEWLKDYKRLLEQPPCEDCISRQAVLDAFRYWFTSAGFEEDRWWNSTHVLAAIEGLPPVTPQPQTGQWIYDDIANNWRCDKCGETPKTMGYVGTGKFMAEHFKFCNHCGVRMIEPQESEK